MRYCNMSMKSL